MTLCSSALRWANFTPRPMCGNTLAYPTITLLLYPSISHATMGRFDNGNYLAHWIPTSVPISRPICLPVALLMMMKSRLTIGRLMWKLLGLKSYNPQTWNYEQIRGAEVKPCLPKIFLLFVPHVTPHDWDLSKVKILRGENAFSVLYKIKLRQNRRLQHLKCLYSQMDRRHSKQYEDEIDR